MERVDAGQDRPVGRSMRDGYSSEPAGDMRVGDGKQVEELAMRREDIVVEGKNVGSRLKERRAIGRWRR